MIKQQFLIEEKQIEFLKNYQEYGFKDIDELIRTALERLQLDLENLEESAQLYAEIYEEDQDLKELTEVAIENWPE